MTLVFVYGTLKRGCSNHGYLAGQKYVGDARTTPGFTLYKVTDYPAMVRSADPGDHVTGEVWEVDAEGLRGLDRLEGIAEGLYTREPIALEASFKDTHVDTYLYARSTARLKKLGSTWVG